MVVLVISSSVIFLFCWLAVISVEPVGLVRRCMVVGLSCGMLTRMLCSGMLSTPYALHWAGGRERWAEIGMARLNIPALLSCINVAVKRVMTIVIK